MKVKVIVLPFETRGWLETVLSVARQMSAKEGDSSGFRKWKYMEIRKSGNPRLHRMTCLEVIHIISYNDIYIYII